MTTKPALTVTAAIETWPIAGQFTIARGAKREAAVVIATVTDGSVTGRGECVPYSRYGETVAGVQAAVLAIKLSGSGKPVGADAGGRGPQCARLRAVGL